MNERSITVGSLHMRCVLCAVCVWVAVGCSKEPQQPTLEQTPSQDPDRVGDVTSLVGRVLDFQTQEPIVGARVESFAPTEVVGTREDGGFALVRDVFPREVYAVYASREGYAEGHGLVQATDGASARVDVLLIPEGDRLPAALEPASIFFDHTTHSVLLRLTNTANESVSWCVHPDSLQIASDSGAQGSMELEPAFGLLDAGESIQVRATLSPEALALVGSSGGIEALRGVVRIRGGRGDLDLDERCEGGPQFLVASALALPDASNPMQMEVVLVHEGQEVCRRPGTGPCEVPSGALVDAEIHAVDRRGSPLSGSWVGASLSAGDEELAASSVTTDFDGSGHMTWRVPETDEVLDISVYINLQVFASQEQAQSPLGAEQVFALRVNPGGPTAQCPEQVPPPTGLKARIQTDIAGSREGVSLVGSIPISGALYGLDFVISDSPQDNEFFPNWIHSVDDLVRVRVLDSSGVPSEAFQWLDASVSSDGWVSLNVVSGEAFSPGVAYTGPRTGEHLIVEAELDLSCWGGGVLGQTYILIMEGEPSAECPPNLPQQPPPGIQTQAIVEFDGFLSGLVLSDSTPIDGSLHGFEFVISDSTDEGQFLPTWEHTVHDLVRVRVLDNATSSPSVDYIWSGASVSDDGWVTADVSSGRTSILDGSYVGPYIGESLIVEVEVDRSCWGRDSLVRAYMLVMGIP